MRMIFITAAILAAGPAFAQSQYCDGSGQCRNLGLEAQQYGQQQDMLRAQRQQQIQQQQQQYQGRSCVQQYGRVFCQ